MDIKASKIVMVPIEKIIPNEKNNNKHSKEQKQRAHKIFDAQGFRSPLLISNRTGKLVAGHLRLEVAKEKGVKELPCMFQDFDSEEQEYQHLTADNALASWSELDLSQINTDILELGPFDIDLLGIKDFTIEPIEKFEPQTDEDEVPEIAHPITRKGDIWLLGNHRLMCGDSTMIDDVEKLMNGEKADMVFTDPPYGISVKMNNSKSYNPETSVEILGDKTTDVAVQSFEICSMMNIPMIFWGANHYAYDAKLPNSKCWIAWNKQESNNHIDQADCELAWTNINSPARQFHHLWAGFRRDSEKGEKRVHPTQKPAELIVEIISHFKKIKSDKILDLFGGSGSTLIACEKMNKISFNMELDEKYCDVIINRWQNYTGKKATLESSGQTYEELKQERGE